MTKKVKEVIRVADLKFKGEAVHSLTKARKAMINSIIRCSEDPKKNASVLETLEVLTLFAKSRAAHGVDVRAKAVEAKIIADKIVKQVAAKQAIKDVEVQLAEKYSSAIALESRKRALNEDLSLTSKTV